MAEFNPPIPEVQPVEPRRGYNIESRLGETIFGNAANLIENWVKYRDEQIQNQIYEEASGNVEKIQQPYIDAVTGQGQILAPETGGTPGVPGTPSAPQGGGPFSIPPSLRQGVTNIALLQAQLESGVIREADYNLKLHAATKGLYAKYPGYRRQIDQTIASITGRDPSNALVANFFEEAEAARRASQSAQDKWESWTRQEGVMGLISIVRPDYWENQEKYSSPEERALIQRDVGILRAEEELRKRERAELQLYAERGQNVALKAYEQAVRRASLSANLFMNTVQSVHKDFFQRLEKAQANPDLISAQEKEALIQQGQMILSEQQLSIERMLNEVDPASGTSLLSLIADKDKLDDIRNAGTAPIRQLLENLTNERYGLATYNARVAQSMLDETQKRILDKFPHMRILDSIRKFGGDIAVDQYMRNVQNQKAFSDTIKGIVEMGILGGEEESLDKAVKKVIPDMKSGELPKRLPTEVIGRLQLMLDPKTDPEIVDNIINGLYGANGGFLENYETTTDQTFIFSRLISPEISKKVFELSRNHPERWQAYVKWATDNFPVLFLTTANDINNAIRTIPDITVVWNPETFQLEMVRLQDEPTPIPKGGITPPRGFFSPWDMPLEHPQVQRSINLLNLQLASIKDIIEMSNLDPSIELLRLLQRAGVDLQAPKEGSFLDQLGSAIMQWKDYLMERGSPKYGAQRSEGGRVTSPF
jgi:hypothetical protein